MRLPILLVLMMAFSAALAADQGACRELRGGRMKGFASPEFWHARVACHGSTLVWFQSVAGQEGTKPAWRVDDLLIIPDLETPQTISLFAPVDVECRQRSDQPGLVFAAGDWRRTGPGDRQPISRAWRMDSTSRTVEEVPPANVTCVVR